MMEVLGQILQNQVQRMKITTPKTDAIMQLQIHSGGKLDRIIGEEELEEIASLHG